MDENKKKSLDLALKQIDKAFGKGTILRLGDKEIEPIDSISTGSIGLDIALGIGGVPKGRIIEIYGPESSGKTTLTLHLIAECQKAGGGALLGRLYHGRRHGGAEISAGLCGQRLLRHDCGLAGGRVPAAAGRDCTHHVAGHPCRKRAHLSERFCADHLAFCAQTEYNKNITNYSTHGNFEGENCNGIF